MSPYSVKELKTDKPLADACLDVIYQYRYGAFAECPECGFPVAHYKMPGRRSYWFCTQQTKESKCPMHQISPTAGTVFADSQVPLPIWFETLYMWDASYNAWYRAYPKHGRIPSTHLERAFDITQVTGYRMKQQIATLYREDRELYDTILLWWVQKRVQ